MLAALELLFVVVLPVLIAVVVLARVRAPAPPPGQLLLVNGRKGPDGRGYSIVRGPTVIRPVIERAELVSIEPLAITASRILRSRSGTELVVDLRANVGFPKAPERLHESLERTLGKSRVEISELASDVLSGTLAHVVAGREPDAVLGDPARLERLVRDGATPALAAIGLELDSLSLEASTPPPA